MRSRITLPRIEERLRHRSPIAIPAATAPARAAVAVCLRPRPQDVEVLLIRRSERKDDPWSGQVALPGGRSEAGDAGPAGTAIREAREEVGLDLERGARLLGRLDDHLPRARASLPRLAITPVVFGIAGEPEVKPNREVAETLWASLDDLRSGRYDSTHFYRLGPLPIPFPCWRYRGLIVWGLTYRILSSLLRLLEDPD